MNRRIEAVVRGRVHGVGFRWWACDRARELGLTGWVANDDDGTVRLVAEGPEGALAVFAADLHRGPPAARVLGVELRWADATGGYSGFLIRPHP